MRTLVKITSMPLLPVLFTIGFTRLTVGRDRPVRIATRYGLDAPGFESWWGESFSTPVHPALYTMATGSFPGVKRPGRGVEHPPYLASRLKKGYSCTSTPPLGLRSLF
jgi:hypothetical protein